MTQELTYSDYKQVVEAQTQAMLVLLTSAKAGHLPQEVTIPDGIPSLNELGLALSHLLGDMQALLAEKVQTQAELEQRIADRTRALEIALDEMQALQGRYLKNEWLEYTAEELNLQPELAQTSEIGDTVSWQPLLTQAVQNQQPVYTDEANQLSHLALPISYSGQLIGLLGFERETSQTWSEDELTAASAVVEQLGLALENQRLFDQTQTALQETQFLYDLAIKLNTANTLDDILQIIIEPAIQQGAHAARLFVYELAEDGRPRWDECVAVWDKEGISKMKVGARTYLPDLPNLVTYFADGSQPTLISNIVTDPKLDNHLRQALLQFDDQAIAMLPLKLGGRWVGTVSINWPLPHAFSSVERRLYKTLMLQTAIVVNNRLLFEQAQERAEQLEIIARVEATLSQATHENEIILALLPSMQAHLPHLITLDYLQLDEISGTESWQPVAWWHNGVIQTDMTFLNQLVPLKQVFLTHWLQTPDQLTLVEDVQMEMGVTQAQKKEAQELGFQAAAMLPLLSGARWQGVVSFIWAQPHNFSAREKFIFRRLMESLGAVVASRRAYLATEATRYETEHLYYASRRINEAHNLSELVAAVGESDTISEINRVILFTFQHDSLDKVQSVLVAATWHRQQIPLSLVVGTYYLPDKFAIFADLLTTIPLFFDNISLDERVSLESFELLQSLAMTAVAILPLWSGEVQRGVVLLASDKPCHFSLHQTQLYMALVRQISVALENQRLLMETQAALAEVEAIQRRYTLQAWENYHAKQPKFRYEKRREESTLAATDSTPLTNYNPTFTVPLQVRGETIGIVGLEEIEDGRVWLPEEIALIEAIAEQAAQAAENLRLLNETQQRAALEAHVNAIGDKIRGAHTLEEAMQMAIKEVGLSLKSPQTTVQLKVR